MVGPVRGKLGARRAGPERLKSADYRSERRIGWFIGAVVVGVFFVIGNVTWWACGLGALAFLLWNAKGHRNYLVVDDQRIISVTKGEEGPPIWWDAVGSLSIERRQPPWVQASPDLAEGREPDYVVVVRMRTGEEVPLWVVASTGGRAGIADPEGRIDAVLQRLEILRAQSTTDVGSAPAGRAVRLRPPGRWYALGINLGLSAIVFALLFWLAGLPWWVAAIPGVAFVMLVSAPQRSYLRVDGSRIVSVVAGTRGRTVEWAAVDQLYVDVRPAPRWAPVSSGEDDEDAHVIVARLVDGAEIPLWAVAALDVDGPTADTERKSEALLARLQALRPSAA